MPKTAAYIRFDVRGNMVGLDPQWLAEDMRQTFPIIQENAGEIAHTHIVDGPWSMDKG
jgi:hypothetical protein